MVLSLSPFGTPVSTGGGGGGGGSVPVGSCDCTGGGATDCVGGGLKSFEFVGGAEVVVPVSPLHATRGKSIASESTIARATSSCFFNLFPP